MRSPSPWRALAVGAPAILATVTLAWAQQWAAPQPSPELRSAMQKADAGSAGDLVRLAEAGAADAQFYAGQMYLSGRGGVARDAARACAYYAKASQARADAAYALGECYRRGLGGERDAAKARAAFELANAKGYPAARCALGELLLADPQQAARGLGLCQEAALAGDVSAQVAVGDAHLRGAAGERKPAEARKWYEMAAGQKDPEAARKLGEMYASGDGGKRDRKKAMSLWRTAEAAGDPLACILVADQLFPDLTGGKKPGPGKFGFKGGVPVKDIEVVEEWYRQALQRDPRPDVKKRAEYALSVLARFKSAGQVAVTTR